MCHDTAVLDVTVAVCIHHANRGRPALLRGRLDVLFPLSLLVNPVDGILPEYGIWLVTDVNAKVDMVTTKVSVGFTALASGETCLLGLGFG
jgi:hypothetical protein